LVLYPRAPTTQGMKDTVHSAAVDNHTNRQTT
jgi:hypothetical protein